MKSYVALGSNVGDRLRHLARARELLAERTEVRVTAASPVYESEPVDCPPESQPFLNAVVELETELTPHRLLDVLLEIESEMEREKTPKRNAPRVIDLDLLLCESCVVTEPKLTVPHPRLAQREFVLRPLADLCPEETVPETGETVGQLLRRLRSKHWTKKVADKW